MRLPACLLLLVGVLPGQEPTIDFVRDVAPVLQERCVSCHGADKQKGDLRLDGRAHALPEESGSIVAGDLEASEFVRRIELPDGDDERMPEEGPSLTAEQIAALKKWIQQGANWPAEGDAWFAAERKKREIPKIDFGIAPLDSSTQARIDAAVAALRLKGVLCLPVASDTPALDVNASLLGAAFGDSDLEQVAQLGPALVWLNLARTSVTDEGIARLQSMPELRRLSLANTAIGDRGIAALGVPSKLESLNLYGSKVTDRGLVQLEVWPALVKVFAFSTAVTEAAANAIVARKPSMAVDRGEYAAQRMAAAEREVAERRRRETPANDTCFVNGEKPSVEHFVDLDNLRIAFCCGKCKKKYEDDPAAYAAKVEALRQKRAAEEASRQQAEVPAGKSGQLP